MTLTRQEAEESKEMDSLRVHADALLSLSGSAKPSTTSPAASRRAMAAEGVFECKTCSKRFTSFQALGGHRTSHTRLQARMLGDPAGAAAERDRARVHECAVCGLEFSMGQALGGHMRRHRSEAPPDAADGAAQPDQAMPDLNFPPLEDDGGSDGQGQEQSADNSSEPRLLNLLV
ncbi:zinc finger protein 1-like [Phragmites australis]|uniref:zinc finger protein 1-like n=1 Tax=Phragmites australis TaxID=29695 RepID=UPI002D78A0DD|nr:zinc finger protein 1-like [Phragmites australis]